MTMNSDIVRVATARIGNSIGSHFADIIPLVFDPEQEIAGVRRDDMLLTLVEMIERKLMGNPPIIFSGRRITEFICIVLDIALRSGVPIRFHI